MKRLSVSGATLAMVGVLGVAGVAMAHHSFAMFDEKKQTMVEGVVTAWNYNNPHVWLMIEAPDATGAKKTWKGTNRLGQVLTELREDLESGKADARIKAFIDQLGIGSW